MQVEKEHYWTKLLLLVLVFASFISEILKSTQFIIPVILNITIFQAALLRSSWLRFTLFSGTLFEVLSSGIIGMYLIKFCIIKCIVEFGKKYFKSIKFLEVIVIASISIFICSYLEFVIKSYMEFHLEFLMYKITVVMTISGIAFVYTKPL